MRPPKSIVLVGPQPVPAGILAFVLRIRGYKVVTEVSAAEAQLRLLEAAGGPFSLLLVLWPLDGGRELLALNKAADRQTAALVLVYEGDLPVFEGTVDLVLRRGKASTAEILERVRVLVARKHGPRPKPDPASILE